VELIGFDYVMNDGKILGEKFGFVNKKELSKRWEIRKIKLMVEFKELRNKILRLEISIRN